MHPFFYRPVPLIYKFKKPYIKKLGQFKTFLLPDDCCLYETLSCNEGFEPTYFYVWFRPALFHLWDIEDFRSWKIDHLHRFQEEDIGRRNPSMGTYPSCTFIVKKQNNDKQTGNTTELVFRHLISSMCKANIIMKIVQAFLKKMNDR